MLGSGDVTGSEDYYLAVWISRVRVVFATLPNLLYFTGVDFKTMAVTLFGSGSFLHMIEYPQFDMPRIEVLLGKLLCWYLIPFFQLVYALIIADAFMYCLHRLGHTNKWFYSKSCRFHRKDV
jgi:sterol desaturase/sphingolipid hydroxylase (fatty acid hydroxylase superfamily)